MENYNSLEDVFLQVEKLIRLSKKELVEILDETIMHLFNAAEKQTILKTQGLAGA